MKKYELFTVKGPKPWSLLLVYNLSPLLKEMSYNK